MKCRTSGVVGATALIWLIGGAMTASAQSANIGRYEFDTYCAVCHGKDGKGGGPFSTLVNKKVPDLTVLSKSNGGVFPFARSFEIINGAEQLAGHGSREMPIWGDHYSEKASDQLGPFYKPSDVAAFVRARIFALIEYLSTLQAK